MSMLQKKDKNEKKYKEKKIIRSGELAYLVKSSKHPPTMMEGTVIRHKMYPNLYYNTRLKGWINEDTQSSVPGLNSPLLMKMKTRTLLVR